MYIIVKKQSLNPIKCLTILVYIDKILVESYECKRSVQNGFSTNERLYGSTDCMENTWKLCKGLS